MKNLFENMQNFFGINGSSKQETNGEILDDEMILDDVLNSDSSDLIIAAACNGSLNCRAQASVG